MQNRQDFKFSQKIENDDDDDDDESENEKISHRVHKSFGRTQRRPDNQFKNSKFKKNSHKEAKKSNKAEKRGRYQHQYKSNQNHHRHFFDGQKVVHFMNDNYD